MKRYLKGSVSIEAAVIIPITLMVVGLVFSMLLYYHDKNILMAASYEAAAYGSCEKERKEQEIETYFVTCVQGRLLLFSDVKKQIQVKKDMINITCVAKEGAMTLKTNCKMKKTDPETYIRAIRNMKHIGEERE